MTISKLKRRGTQETQFQQECLTPEARDGRGGFKSIFISAMSSKLFLVGLEGHFANGHLLTTAIRLTQPWQNHSCK